MLRSSKHTDQEQAGFSLVELLVAMFVFSIFLTVLLSSVIGITRASSRAQLLAQSSTNVLAVFQSLDRQIRYADAINFPGTGSSGSRYFEFRTRADSTPSGLVTCTQWRFTSGTGVLEYREWEDAVGATPTAWSTKISSVLTLAGADYPFKLVPASIGGSSMQQLVLTIAAGTALVTPGASISTTFVARNSSIQSPSNSDTRVAGTSDTPVCLATGSRP